jgi:hypothetical protein
VLRDREQRPQAHRVEEVNLAQIENDRRRVATPNPPELFGQGVGGRNVELTERSHR